MQSKQLCINNIHMRTSPPWLQHRDLKLCHDLSHFLLRTCLIHNSAPHPANARSFIVLVTPFPQCHHHQTTLSFSPIATRGFVTVPIENGWMGTHSIRLLSPVPRVSLSARTSVSPSAVPADLTTAEFQFVSVENFTSTHSLYVVILCGLL